MKTKKQILLVAVAVLLAVFAVGCSFSVSTAKIDSAIMTDSIDSQGKPGNEVTSYSADTMSLYTSAVIRNAPDHTQIRIVWTYVSGDQQIYEVKLDSGTISDRYISSSLDTSVQLPTGDYKVEYFVEKREVPDAVVNFTIVAADASLEDAHMTTNMDESGMPVDSIDTVLPAGTWYVSAILRNGKADTKVQFVWYDINGDVIDQYYFDPQGKTDIYIFGSLELNSIAPAGDYRVELYLDDATAPSTTVSFTVSDLMSENDTDLGAYTPYSQKANGLSMEYPSNWAIYESNDKSVVWFYPEEYAVKDEDDINALLLIILKGSGAGYTADTVLQEWIDETEADNLEDYQFVDKATDTLNGKDISALIYGWTKGDYTLYTMDFLILDGDDLYILTFTAEADKLDELFPYVEKAVMSFQLS